jgi:hypothetical protein
VTKKPTTSTTQHTFAKLVIIANNRSIDMRSILTHEVGPVPLALISADGKMRMTQKSQLFKVLEDRFTETEPISATNTEPVAKVIIIDSMSVIQVIKGTGMFKQYAENVLNCIMKGQRV